MRARNEEVSDVVTEARRAEGRSREATDTLNRSGKSPTLPAPTVVILSRRRRTPAFRSNSHKPSSVSEHPLNDTLAEVEAKLGLVSKHFLAGCPHLDSEMWIHSN